MCFIVGILGILTGIVNSIRKPQNTLLDRFFLQPMAGVLLLLSLAMVVRWYVEPWVIIGSKSLKSVIGFEVYKVLNLNYVVLGLLVGVIITNTIGIPKFAAAGVKTARFVLKMGVILLGARYSFAELAKLGVYSIWLVGGFVMGNGFPRPVAGQHVQTAQIHDRGSFRRYGGLRRVCHGGRGAGGAGQE